MVGQVVARLTNSSQVLISYYRNHPELLEETDGAENDVTGHDDSDGTGYPDSLSSMGESESEDEDNCEEDGKEKPYEMWLC